MLRLLRGNERYSLSHQTRYVWEAACSLVQAQQLVDDHREPLRIDRLIQYTNIGSVDQASRYRGSVARQQDRGKRLPEVVTDSFNGIAATFLCAQMEVTDDDSGRYLHRIQQRVEICKRGSDVHFVVIELQTSAQRKAHGAIILDENDVLALAGGCTTAGYRVTGMDCRLCCRRDLDGEARSDADGGDHPYRKA